ncbi:hypothetical protein NFJ02_11g05300 [Pycnococcus provasolii]
MLPAARLAVARISKRCAYHRHEPGRVELHMSAPRWRNASTRARERCATLPIPVLASQKMSASKDGRDLQLQVSPATRRYTSSSNRRGHTEERPSRRRSMRCKTSCRTLSPKERLARTSNDDAGSDDKTKCNSKEKVEQQDVELFCDS